METIAPITWLLNLDASGARDGLKDFVAEALKGFDDIEKAAQQKKWSTLVWELSSKSVRKFVSDTIADLNTVGNSAQAVGARIGKAFNDIKFTDLKRNITELDNMLKQHVLSAETAAAVLARINTEAVRRNQTMESGRTTLRFMGVGLAATGAYAARSLYSNGMAGTGEEQQGQFVRHMLGREVASIFAPISREMTQHTSELTGWMQHRSQDERRALQTAGMFGMSAATMVPLMSMAGSAGANYFGASEATSKRFGRVGGMIGLGVAALSSTPEGRNALLDLIKAFEPVMLLFVQAVRELSPSLAEFAKGLKNMIPTGRMGIRSGAMIGGGIGYLAGGWRGAAIGGLAGQGIDMLGGNGSVGNLATIAAGMPGTIGGGALGAQIGGLRGAAIGVALGSTFDRANAGIGMSDAGWHGMGGVFADRVLGPGGAAAAAGKSHDMASSVGLGWLNDFVLGSPQSMANSRAGGGDMNLSPTARGFESVEQSWDRLANAAQQVDLQQQVVTNTANTVDALRELINKLNTPENRAAKRAELRRGGVELEE